MANFMCNSKALPINIFIKVDKNTFSSSNMFNKNARYIRIIKFSAKNMEPKSPKLVIYVRWDLIFFKSKHFS